jgi:hypothetical protein
MKIMRCEDSVLKTENLHKGNTGKTVFEKAVRMSLKRTSLQVGKMTPVCGIF